VTLNLWNFLKVLHEFSAMVTVGSLLTGCLLVWHESRRATADAPLPNAQAVRRVNLWLTTPALGLLLATGLGMALTNSYRLSPTYILTSLIALAAAIPAWALVALPGAARFAAAGGWRDGRRSWWIGVSITLGLILFGAAMMVIRPVWWEGVSAYTPP